MPIVEDCSPRYPTLETERLWLRPFRLSDWDDYAALCADPEVRRYVGSGQPLGRIAAWGIFALIAGHWQYRGYGMWAVEEKATGAFAGQIGFHHPDGWPGFELAWTLARRFWGRGYATEGARAALDHAFTVLAKDRVLSLIRPENAASIRVAERLGERPTGCTEVFGKEYLVYAIEQPRTPGFRQGPGCHTATKQSRRLSQPAASCSL